MLPLFWTYHRRRALWPHPCKGQVYRAWHRHCRLKSLSHPWPPFCSFFHRAKLFHSPNEQLTSFIGSFDYVAPEVIRNTGHGKLVDICKFLSHQLRFPSLRTFYWHPDPSNGLPKEEMGALRSLVLNFPPNISKLHLFYAKAWSDGFMEFVFVKLEGFAFLAVKPPWFFSFCHYSTGWMIARVVAFCHCLPRSWLNPYIWNAMRKTARMDDKIASHIVPLFHLHDPHKTRQFSLYLVRFECIVSKAMHEAYVSLKKDGYAFKISYYDSHLSKVPLPDW